MLESFSEALLYLFSVSSYHLKSDFPPVILAAFHLNRKFYHLVRISSNIISMVISWR